ncbi:DUF1566 domain-containing protein, partial [Vibrio sp.]|uniref:Lcl domain-containing protein n=1 Tax=Vibrio sp. TaxID=678 RepID=UPI003D134E6A
DIQITPSTVSVTKGQTGYFTATGGQTVQLTATATYGDGTSSDITNTVTWAPVDTNTVTVTSAGLLSGVEGGETTLIATKDGITSNTINVTVCGDLAGACIDAFDTGSGKLFTNSPSVPYLDSIGGSATDGTFTENTVPSSDGSPPVGLDGDFYTFAWDNANVLCATYNTQNLAGRTNWRLATRDELKTELFDVYGHMFHAREWPTTFFYWSSTSDSSNYYFVRLSTGSILSTDPSIRYYASCVSEP